MNEEEWKYTEPFTIRSSSGRFCGKYKIKYKDNSNYLLNFINNHNYIHTFLPSFLMQQLDISLVPIVERFKDLRRADIIAQSQVRERVRCLFVGFAYTSVNNYEVKRICDTYTQDLLYSHKGNTLAFLGDYDTLYLTLFCSGGDTFANVSEVDCDLQFEIKKPWEREFYEWVKSGKMMKNLQSYISRKQLGSIKVVDDLWYVRWLENKLKNFKLSYIKSMGQKKSKPFYSDLIKTVDKYDIR